MVALRPASNMRAFLLTLLSLAVCSTAADSESSSKPSDSTQDIQVDPEGAVQATTAQTPLPSVIEPWEFGFGDNPRAYVADQDNGTITVSFSEKASTWTLYWSHDDAEDEGITSFPDEDSDSSGGAPSSNQQRKTLLKREDLGLFTVGSDRFSSKYTITIHPSKIPRFAPPPSRLYFVVTSESGKSLPNSPFFGLLPIGSSDASLFFGDELTSTEAAEDPQAPTTSVDNALSNLPAATRTDTESSSAETGDGNATMDSSAAEKKDSGGGGLAPGAIAGIAIGAFAAVVIILGLIWFFMRRRKRANEMSVHPDASTPLAGYPNAAARSGEYMGEKEAGAMAMAESPRSQMYTDQPDHHRSSQGPSTLGTAAVGGGASSRYAEGYDAGSSPPPPSAAAVAAGHATPLPPREESSRADMNSPVPSTTVARHLVDPDMTEDEIRRLEEEERELDRQIQEAGRRK